MNNNGAPPDRRERVERIKQLNDALRTTGVGGRIFVTGSVAEIGSRFVQKAISAMATFDSFNEDNDPYGEHDFGGFEVDGETLFFKIDYYDSTMTAGSEDPADPARCTRVLTLMHASDY